MSSSSRLLQRIVESSKGLCCSASRSQTKVFVGNRFVSSKVQPLHISSDDRERFQKLNVPNDFRLAFPEFIPDPKSEWRNRLREKLERKDMVTRRKVAPVPEFYVGSIMAVTVSDASATGTLNRLVGICIQKGGTGLRAWFIIRNVIDHLGVEIKYETYCPLIQSIETLRLEKRLDDELLYLRDAPPEYSTFPFDMDAEPLLDGIPVPINDIKIPLKPRPWHQRWERKNLKGIQPLNLPVRFFEWAKEREKPWEKYDLMMEYRSTIPEEEQAKIYEELLPHMPQLEASRRKVKRGKIQRGGRFQSFD